MPQAEIDECAQKHTSPMNMLTRLGLSALGPPADCSFRNKGCKPVRRLVQVRCFGSRQPITHPSINSSVRSFRTPSGVLPHSQGGR
jgi:hypothetical protein